MATDETVIVLFGGRSFEHDVSIQSAIRVVRALDQSAFNVLPIYITRHGEWRLVERSTLDLTELPSRSPVAFVPGHNAHMMELASTPRAIRVGAAFPVLHGPGGEDGTIQGFLETVGIPCVGAGVAGAAMTMDKALCKAVLTAHGIPTVPGLVVDHGTALDTRGLIDKFGKLLYVKPTSQGSSFGVSRVDHPDQLEEAVNVALRFGRRVLIEKGMKAREIEVGIFTRKFGDVFVSRPGEIVVSNNHLFYDFDAKYNDPNGCEIRMADDLPSGTSTRLRDTAYLAAQAVGCLELARVDFFLLDDGSFFVNEINAIPGFTTRSMFPALVEASGIHWSDAVQDIIARAMLRSGPNAP
jgi:D-alanine-D-alanine ligase